MDRPRIGIDGYNLALRHGTGIATYGMTLARTLQAAGHPVEGVFGVEVGSDPALREVEFFDRLNRAEQPHRTRREARREKWRVRRETVRALAPLPALHVPLTDRVEKGAFADRFPPFDRLVSSPRLFDIAHRHFAATGRFVRLRMADPPPVMHWTYPVPVELIGARNIYTLHDLVPLKLPYTTLDNKHAYHAIVRRCVERAAHICTVSEASRADIVALLGADPADVTNTYQASVLPDAFLSQSAAEDAAIVEGVFGLPPQGYFLFLGAIEPKKNLGRLIEAHLSTGSDTPLVIVGGRGWQSEDELKLLPRDQDPEDPHFQSVARRIVRLDFLHRPLLLRLIRSARAVLLPSLYEGFGLPVLEAMQLGTPVLTSAVSALPEVAGNAALLVDPYDPSAIAAALRALDGDPALRARLTAAGPVQAARFSEDRYRERLDLLYEKVLGRSQTAARA